MGDPVVIHSWHVPRALSDEALRLLTSLPMEEIKRRLRVDGPAVREGKDPALRPVPVVERLPGPDDCDGYGHYWWFSFVELAWVFADLEYAKNRGYTHWLPAHRLPLPPLPEFDHD